MIVQDKMVKGGIAAVISGYYGSILEEDYDMIYVESYKDGGKITKLIKAICGYFHFAKVLIVDKPDLIHIHSSFGPSFYRKIPFIYMATWAKKPIVNHIHGADFNEFYVNASKKKKSIIKKVYNKCDILVALSDEWKLNLSTIVPSNKIKIIENYSVLHADALEERISRESNNMVLFLGEIGKRKGCYDIPEVIKKVLEVVPNVKFILGGSGSLEDEKNVKKLLIDNKVENCVEFPGWIRGADKDKLLRKADLFFLPSYNEGMPMSILDVIGYGLPVVSTSVGGIPKLVHNNENGLCCEAGNTLQMANKISEILSNKEMRRQYSISSYKIAKTFSLQSHITKIEECYKQLII